MKTNTHSKDLETKKKSAKEERERKRGIIEVNKIAAEIIK